MLLASSLPSSSGAARGATRAPHSLTSGSRRLLVRHSPQRGGGSLTIPDLPPHLAQELDELEASGHCGTEG